MQNHNKNIKNHNKNTHNYQKRREKIFDKTDGEYVEFEEIKEEK